MELQDNLTFVAMMAPTFVVLAAAAMTLAGF